MRLKSDEQCFSSNREQVRTIPLLEHSLVIERGKGKRPEPAILSKKIQIAVQCDRIRIGVECGCDACQGILLERHARHRDDDMTYIECGIFKKLYEGLAVDGKGQTVDRARNPIFMGLCLERGERLLSSGGAG